MEFGHLSYSLANTVRQILRWVADSLTTDPEPSALERPLSNGSEMTGDYNFRTGKMDGGSDPIGWYEEDV